MARNQGIDGGRESVRLGSKVRALRRRENLSQTQLAIRLGISGSYLNLIESNRRPLPAPLLIKLAQELGADLQTFAVDTDARTNADLIEAFADPMFDPMALNAAEVREFVIASPSVAQAVVGLYRAYKSARASAESLAARLSDGEVLALAEHSTAPTEEVNDFVQEHNNYFAALEAGAERLWVEADLDSDDLYRGLANHLTTRQGVTVSYARSPDERRVLRRYDPQKRVLTLSELLPTRSRTFQLAYQIALLTQREVLDALTANPRLTSLDAKALTRVALANYFAGAVLMPYERFLAAARTERYDVDVLGRRFRVGFEQTCHRLTTLRRPGNEGIALHMLRIDVAGNISKRFSASGIRFARFSGACPRWNVFAAFATPGMIRIQVSRMTDNTTYFCLARTIQRDSTGYQTQPPVQAIGLGCRIEDAGGMVYSDGIALRDGVSATLVGVTCRQCDRTDCDQRALPSLRQPLRIDQNVRGLTLYTTPSDTLDF